MLIRYRQKYMSESERFPQCRFACDLLGRMQNKGLPCPNVVGGFFPSSFLDSKYDVLFKSDVVSVCLKYEGGYISATEHPYDDSGLEGAFNRILYHADFVDWDKLITEDMDESLKKLCNYCKYWDIYMELRNAGEHISLRIKNRPLILFYSPNEKKFNDLYQKYTIDELLNYISKMDF